MQKTWRQGFAAAVTTVLVVIASAAVISLPAPSAAALAPPLAWADCGDGLQCAKVKTPVNWRDPHAKTIDIALAKLPAKDQATKLGPLLFHPGGPAAALPAFRRNRAQFAELTQWFDVIVFDARGFGDSAGVTCPSSPTISGSLVAAPFDHQQWQEQERKGREFDLGCRAALGELAGNLDSWQVAHDMDAIRAAHGQQKLAGGLSRW